MSKVTYEIVEHDGAWAYRVTGVFSEPFPSDDLARQAAERAAGEQRVPGDRTGIRTKTRAGHWHDELASGRDRRIRTCRRRTPPAAGGERCHLFPTTAGGPLPMLPGRARAPRSICGHKSSARYVWRRRGGSIIPGTCRSTCTCAAARVAYFQSGGDCFLSSTLARRQEVCVGFYRSP